jgi:hypothetical protein
VAVTREVAFFRNLNLGQRRSPSRDQLLAAMSDAGAADAQSFQVNGTVVFAADDPQAVADEAARLLVPVSGWDDVVLVRPLDWLASLRLEEVEGNAEVTFFDGPADFPGQLPWEAPRGEVTVLDASPRHAVVLNHREHRSNGTPVVEALLGVPATSRGVPTLLRLLDRHDRG